MGLYPFAQLLPFTPTVSPVFLVPILGLVVVVFLLRIYNIWNEARIDKKRRLHRKEADQSGKTGYAWEGTQAPSRKELKLANKMLAFDKEQSAFFADVCLLARISRPILFMEDATAQEDVFTRIWHQYQALPASKEAERNKNLLFIIREAIGNHLKSGKPIGSTRSVPIGQQFSLTVKTGEQYPSSVAENTGDGLLCAVPRDLFGNELPPAALVPARSVLHGRQRAVIPGFRAAAPFRQREKREPHAPFPQQFRNCHAEQAP